MKIQLLVLLLLTANLGFGQQTVGVFQNDSLAFNGYTLLFPAFSKNTWLLDNCGNVVNEWESDYAAGLSAYLLENGDLLRTAKVVSDFLGGGTGGRIERFNWEGELIWSYNYATTEHHQHHDIEYLPNGNILMIAWEKRNYLEALEKGKNPDLQISEDLWSEQVVELQPQGINGGQIVWEWHLWDHLIQDFDSSKSNFGVVADHPELLDINKGSIATDWIHFNSIDYNEALDQIVLSSRNLDEILIIDHSTTSAQAASHSGGNAGKGGDFLYRWGNPQNYNQGTDTDQIFFGQHDAQWIPSGVEDAGKLMVFNNGIGRPGGSYSTIDIWQPSVDASGNYDIIGGKFGPTALSWTYGTASNNSFFSANMSGVQRLPNGNTLICEGQFGHLFEVTYNGTKVWDYVSPVVSQGFVTQGNEASNNNIFRAYRYGVNYPAFENVELLSGEPLELNPTNQDCQIFDEIVSTKEWSLFSESVKVVNNPIGNQIFIENNSSEKVYFEMIDLLGRTVLSGVSEDQFFYKNTSNLEKGIYIVRFFEKVKNQFVVVKVIKN